MQNKSLMISLHVADATVVSPGWFWNDAFLTNRYGGNICFVLKHKHKNIYML